MKPAIFKVAPILLALCLAACTTTTTSETTAKAPAVAAAMPHERPVAGKLSTDLAVSFRELQGTREGGSADNYAADIEFTFTNVSGKNIRGIKGKIVAYDRFGERLGVRENVDLETTIDAGHSFNSTWAWDPMTERFYRMLRRFPQGPVFKFETEKVAYE